MAEVSVIDSEKTVLGPVGEGGGPSLLATGCVYCLEQCETLLQQLSEEDFSACQPGHSSAGTHLRHLLDRFQCFFDGLASNHIDYDHRERNRRHEQEITAARNVLQGIINRFRNLELDQFQGITLEIRESVHPDGPAVVTISTVDRELMGLISHSIHHLAIIGLLLKPLGYQFDSDFGKAPSTIIHERS